MTFRVLKPTYRLNGKKNYIDGKVIDWCDLDYIRLGYADDMQDALDKFPRNFINGYSPILEWVGGRLH